jgi:hypothetical protein
LDEPDRFVNIMDFEQRVFPFASISYNWAQ